LPETANSPITQLYFSVTNIGLEVNAKAKRICNGIFSEIISLNSRNLFKILSYIPPEWIFLSLIFIKYFKIITLFSDVKIY